MSDFDANLGRRRGGDASRPRYDKDMVLRCNEILSLVVSYRLSSRWGGMTPESVRNRIAKAFTELQAWTDNDPARREQFREIKPLLVYAVDGIMLSSPNVSSGKWPLLETDEFGTSHGGAHFFTIVNQAGKGTEELQCVAYLCLMAGFKGMHAHNPDTLEEIQHKLYKGLDPISPRRGEKITPQAYANTVERRMYQMPIVNSLRLLIISAGVVAILLVGSYLVYERTVQSMTSSARKAADLVEGARGQ